MILFGLQTVRRLLSPPFFIVKMEAKVESNLPKVTWEIGIAA
jgi:hypothetical protein